MENDNNQLTQKATFMIESPNEHLDLILENLRKVEGVTALQESSDQSKITLEFDPTRIDPSQLINLTSQAGFSMERNE